MGRSHYGYVPSFYVAFPTLDVFNPLPSPGGDYGSSRPTPIRDLIRAATYPNTGGAGQELLTGRNNDVAAVLQAFGYSLNCLADASPFLKLLCGANNLTMGTTGSTATGTQIGPFTGAAAPGTPYSGISLPVSVLPHSYDPGIGGLRDSFRRGSNWTAAGSSLILDVTGAEQVAYPSGYFFLSPRGLGAIGGVSWAPLAYPMTFFPGPLSGGICTLPIGPISAVTDVAALALHKTITVPTKYRLHEVNFMATASAANNSVRLKNETTGQWLTPETALTTAGMSSTVVAAANLTNRTISRGDVVGIYIKAPAGASTGPMTSLSVTLTGHTMGHPTDQWHRDIDHNSTSQIPFGSNTKLRSSLSGPAVGGLAVLQLQGQVTYSATGTAVIGKCTAPFKCRPVYLAMSHDGTVTSATTAVRNSTQSDAVVVGATPVVSGATGTFVLADNADTTVKHNSHLIQKGDVLEATITTSATDAFTRCCAALLVHVLDFPTSNARYD